MRLLAIETATPAQSVALVEDDRLLAELSYEAQGNRGGVLLPAFIDAHCHLADPRLEALRGLAEKLHARSREH